MKGKNKIKEALAFQDLTPEEKEKRGILARLYGPCASIIIPTRNGRAYNEKLWDYQFEHNDILKEMIENGGIPMELDHPADREETDSQKIAAMLPELPKKDEDGHLICYCDIIDTPCGRIAYQLAKYGFKLGISSRGTGDLIEDEDGNESVDPETYDLTTFDLVLLPAVKDARLTMQESLNKTKYKKSLRTALKESLESASEDDRKVMEDTLSNLGIDLDAKEDSIEKNEDSTHENEMDIDNNDDKQVNECLDANNDGSVELIRNLQESLKQNIELKNQLKSLQEKLAVSDAKVDEMNEEIGRYKSTTIRLSSMVKDSKKETSRLEEALEKSNTEVESLKARIEKLRESRKTIGENAKKLNENMANSHASEITQLNEKLESQKADYESRISKLEEDLSKSKGASTKLESTQKQMAKTVKLAEGYKKAATSIMNRYIEMRATMLGVSATEIKNRLEDSYTIDDVDTICENLQAYNLNISKLPVNINRCSKVKITEKKDPILNHVKKEKELVGDDDIDDSLFQLAGLI